MRCMCCGFNNDGKSFADIAEMVTFSPTERVVFDMLASNPGRIVPAQKIVDAVYGNLEDGGALTAFHTITIMVVRLRKKLARFGVVIEGHTGRLGGRRMVWAAEA